MHIDEARSGMRMMGTIDEIIAWQPPDWPPLHNVLLGGWSQLTGEYPFSLRVFSAFFSLIGVCFAYQMGYQLTHDRRVALGTLIVYGCLGMAQYLGIFIRGYAIVLALLPLAILLMVRYFEYHRWRDAFGLGITLAIMFMTTYTSVFAFAAIGLLSVLLYWRQLWRWVIIAVIASPAAIYEFVRKQDYWINRISTHEPYWFNYKLPTTFIEHYQDYFGHLGIIWLILIGVALVAWLWKGRTSLRLLFWIIVCCLLAPVITFVLVDLRVFKIMTTRYSWWMLIPMALGLAYGLRYLPRIIWLGVLALVLGMMMTLPLVKTYYPYADPVSFFTEGNMLWLQQNSQIGDVLIYDPNRCEICRFPDELTYFWDVYLDDRVTVVDEIADHRRIWLWRGIGHSREFLETIKETHLPSRFFGPPEALLELYEAPPDPDGILYDNGMRFHGFEIIQDNGKHDLPPYDLREQTQIKVRFWWSADRPIDNNYQVSFQIYDRNRQQLFLQDDAAPQLTHIREHEFTPLPSVTSEWAQDTLYVEERLITFPNTLSEIHIDLYLIIYRLSDGERILAPDMSDEGLRKLDEAIIWGWG